MSTQSPGLAAAETAGQTPARPPALRRAVFLVPAAVALLAGLDAGLLLLGVPAPFHVVGGQFDTVYAEGAYQLQQRGSGGAQALALAPGQGGFVELTLPEAGHYPFVSHVMVDAEHGAHGVLAVTG